MSPNYNRYNCPCSYLKLESASAITYLAWIDPVEGAEPAVPPTYTCTPHDLAMIQPHFAMPYFRDIRLKSYIQNNGLTLIVQVQLCSFLDRRALQGLSLGSGHSTVHGRLSRHLRRASILALWKCTEGKRVYSLVTLSKKKLHTHMKYNSIPAAATY